MAGMLGGLARARAIELGHEDRDVFQWPSKQYQRDPVGFGRNILGVRTWEFQDEIQLSVRDNVYTAVCGGRKLGKDFAVGILALWFYCSFAHARVRFTAVTDRQVNEVFWLQVRQLLAGHGRCVRCKKLDPRGPRPCPHSRIIPEEPGTLARTGLKSVDFREIVGLTAKEAEGAAGISGPAQFNIIDEASGVPDYYWEAVDGNMGGSDVARLCALSNGTRTNGAFWRAFHARSSGYHTIQRSSRTSPNVLAGRTVIPGLATRAWVGKMVEKYGEGSDFVKVHVDGEFPSRAQGRVFGLPLIQIAVERWALTKPDHRPLCISIDVAGESGKGDESVFTARRGTKMLEQRARRGLTPAMHLVEALQMVAQWKLPNDDVRIIIDRGGEDGAKVWGEFLSYRQQHWKDDEDGPFKLIGVRPSDVAGDRKLYDRVRDELVGNLAEWMRNGGAITDDAMLHIELHEFRWQEREGDQLKLIDKAKMREVLGRSPDRADSLALAAWGDRERPLGLPAPSPEPPKDERAVAHQAAVTSDDPRDWTGEAGFDPYAFQDEAIGRRR